MFVETHRDFHNKHGGDAHAVYLEGGAWILYEDGAQMENSQWGVRHEPPEDPKLLARGKVLYWEAKAEAAVKAFNLRKAELLEQNGPAFLSHTYVGADRDREWAEIEAMQKDAQRCLAELKKAKDAEEALVPQEQRDREAAGRAGMMGLRQENSRYLERLKALRI